MRKILKPIIIDDFLPFHLFNEMKDAIVGNPGFPWYHQTYVAYAEANDGDYYTHLLYHENKPNSVLYDAFEPLVAKINPYALNRIKVNRYPRTKNIVKHTMHIDDTVSHHGAIFYLNTCNGKTIFESGEEIESIENRLMIFDPSLPHQSTTCTDDILGRYNINMNFYETPLLNT